MSSRNERFEVRRPMTMEEAKEMAGALATMGCSDFEYVPHKEAA